MEVVWCVTPHFPADARDLLLFHSAKKSVSKGVLCPDLAAGCWRDVKT